jgi:hypothetical protein
MPAEDIDQVIVDLTRIIDDCIERESKLGFFAALYRKVTIRVRDDIARGDVFEDNDRVERLDVVFANRYLTAYGAHQRGEPCRDCWQVAFDAAAGRRLIIIQHLLLGINAHINLDLGAAAAAVSPGSAIGGLKHDFDMINQVLADLVAGVIEDVGRLSPWLALLDRVGARTERATINFSIDVARRQAWEFAQELAPVEDRSRMMEDRDRVVADLGKLVRHPGPLVSTVNLIIKAREVKDVARIIEVLAD